MFKDKIINFFKQPFIYIIIICIFCQFKVYSTVAESVEMADTTTYINYVSTQDILHGKLDQNRTPVYPYFIKVVKVIFGEENLQNNIAFAQKILFIFVTIAFYACISLITKNKFIVSILTLIFGSLPSIILWNVPILTEALSIAEMVFLALMTLKYLKKPSFILSASIGIMVLIMILTRPSFIYLLPIYLLFWILKTFMEKEERKKAIVGIISCGICVLVLLGYCALINKEYGVFNLTRISNLNNVLSVEKSKAYKNYNNEEMVKVIDDDYAQNKNIWEIYDTLIQKYDEDELVEMANATIKTPQHLKFLVKKTVYLGTLNIGTNYVDRVNLAEDDSFYKLNFKSIEEVMLPINFSIVYIMLAGSIIYLVWNLFKSKKIDWIMSFFTVLILANVFTLIVGAPEEEQRLFVSSIPLVILQMVYIFEKIMNKKRKNKDEEAIL